ncbi:hypothetical protein PPERSA_10757 [Pseudocohnilembus persalinus]|uniref:C3H1-type domain-containing protein n=1 Tax=Pseudocohnilembus persalinus TaxID=266149 RepID=A0A0V0QDK8_PSEPJ|nr:hypothetical protein PPERSA_10757 [Pseudocohnilembus persalinus]|eukprot:KRX00258.1 hypothetical protein PPERSA_10757 [Pseudocohnilembus persalinus]
MQQQLENQIKSSEQKIENLKIDDQQSNQSQKFDEDQQKNIQQQEEENQNSKVNQIQDKEEIQQMQNQRWDNLEDDEDEEENEEDQNDEKQNTVSSYFLTNSSTENKQNQENKYKYRNYQSYNKQNQSTVICQNILKGSCKFGQKCRFSHGKYGQKYPNINPNINYKKNLNQRKFAPTCLYYLQNSCLKENQCELYHPKFQQYTIDPSEFYFDLDDIKRTNQINSQEQDYLNYQIQEINHQFDPQDNCLIIRHALSHYNYIGDRFIYETGKSFLDKSSKQFQVNEQLIDAELHYYGLQQCKTVEKKVQEIEDLQVVFVSPLQRSLQTCLNIFQQHPNFINKSMKIIVLPQLMEILSKVQDISTSLHSTIKQKYKDLGFDFSLFESPEMNTDTWQLQVIKDKDVKKSIAKQIEEEKAKWEKICIRSIRQSFPKSIETNESVEQRANEVLEYIQDYIKQNKLEEKKIAIISHAKIIKLMLKQKQQHEKFYNYKQNVANCQIISINL